MAVKNASASSTAASSMKELVNTGNDKRKEFIQIISCLREETARRIGGLNSECKFIHPYGES
jgi:hypothetical protein